MHTRRILAVCLSLCLPLVPACSSGSSSPAPPAFDLSGTWAITEQITTASGGCVAGLVGQKATGSFQFFVAGNTLSVTELSTGHTTSAHVSGNKASWSTAEVNGAITYREQGSGTFTATTFNATTTWQTIDSSSGGGVCSGASVITGLKTSASTIGDSLETPNMYVLYDDNSVEFGHFLLKNYPR